MLKQEMPYVDRDAGGKYLVVDGSPFLALGGELHNSSGSSLEYMDTFVWPALRKLGGNCYLTPAYWECLEPEPGRYDYTLIDGVIEQARREGVRLGLLWFGIWKNGASEYVPLWLKQNHDIYQLAKDEKGAPLNSISPFCQEAVELDKRAFTKLMEHLKEFDGDTHTVIMIQVENEIGIWHHDRDFSKAANKYFEAGVPKELTDTLGKTGSWEVAFPGRSCEAFMAYYYARDIEAITHAGREVYNLPMFMNCVSGGMGFAPAGGPDSIVHDIWEAVAPSIDWFSPDIYAPDFKGIAGRFKHDDNPLFIPETGCGPDCAAKVLNAVGGLNCIGFNPFGIEQAFESLSDLDYASQGVQQIPGPKAGPALARAYQILFALWPEIRQAHIDGTIHAFMKGQTDFRSAFETQDYHFNIQYNTGSRGSMSGMAPMPEVQGPPAASSGFIIERKDGSFLFAGTNISLSFEDIRGGRETVMVQDKREMLLQEGQLVNGRILNGDERNVMAIGLTPQVITFRLDKHQ